MSWRFNLTNIFVIASLIACVFFMMHLSNFDVLDPPFVLTMPLKFLVCGSCLWCYIKGGIHLRSVYLSVTLVLLLMLVGIFRGIFAVDGYWGYKGWVECMLCALSFVLIFPLGNPIIAGKMLQCWNKYVFPVFLLFGLWALNFDAYPFQIPFIYYFYVLLFSIAVSDKKARLIIIMGTLCTLAATENRSGIIKTMVAFLLCTTIYLHYDLRKVLHVVILFFFYLIPIVLLLLGLTGTFNIFRDLASDESVAVTRYNDEPDEQNEGGQDLTADTRTFLYIEVITSAIEGDYVLFGNSIGRGNTTNFIWTDVEEMQNERLMNEAHVLNIFTWLGVVGVILYTIMYLQASCLGLFCSKNKYVPLIACAVAFHWAMLWLEECPSFKPVDFALFLLLGICFSPKFRRMTDSEFRLWFRSCFSSPEKQTSYIVLKKLRWQLLLMKKLENEKT